MLKVCSSCRTDFFPSVCCISLIVKVRSGVRSNFRFMSAIRLFSDKNGAPNMGVFNQWITRNRDLNSARTTLSGISVLNRHRSFWPVAV